MIDKQAFVGGIDLGVEANDRWDVSFGYQTYLGSRVESHAANLKLRFRF